MTGERDPAEVHDGFLHRNANTLPFAGKFALIERAENTDRQMQSGTGIGEGRTGLDRRSIRLAGEGDGTTRGLCDRIEAAKVPVGAFFAEPPHGAVDDFRVDLADGIVSEAELVRGA